MFFLTVPRWRARFENHRELASNAFLERVMPKRALEERFFEFRNAKMTPEVPLGRLGRLPGAPLGPSWPSTWPSCRPLGDSSAASWPLLGGLDSLLATLVAPKLRNFARWVHFWMTSARLGLRLLSKSCENVPRACKFIAKTCLQRRASNVELPQGCGGRAKRTQ